MTDLMDQRLVAAGRRWQAEQPPPPAVPLERLGTAARPRRVSVRAGLAAAAVVVLVGGGAVILSRAVGTDHAGPSDTSSSPTVHVRRVPSVVPWRDLRARHAVIAHREHGRLVTPFDNVLADGHLGGHLHPGDVLRFTVFLESDTDISLYPCPDYSVVFGTTQVRSWQLNCAQVPYRQSSRRTSARPSPGVTRLNPGRWHPVLPARTRLRFEMRVRVPDVSGRQKVLWTLDGPTTMPGFYGIVHVS